MLNMREKMKLDVNNLRALLAKQQTQIEAGQRFMRALIVAIDDTEDGTPLSKEIFSELALAEQCFMEVACGRGN